MKKIYLAVFNDLAYDQRMQRICTTLAKYFEVVLVGRKTKITKSAVGEPPYAVYRLHCYFDSGKLRYIEFNIRLFFFLLRKQMHALCATDLDTIVPCYLVARWKSIPMVYDAHELFTEMKEVVTRPRVHRVWLAVERYCVPSIPLGYTVSTSIADEFYRRYRVQYEVIRNLPVERSDSIGSPEKHFILYQGAINEARGLEILVPAMKQVDAELHIYGSGNFEKMLYRLVEQYQLGGKVFIHPPVAPDLLKQVTDRAYIGINLVENTGLNQYYSLANKFFDYMQSGVPQVTMRYPEYEAINKACEIAVLIDELSSDYVAAAINKLLDDVTLYARLRNNCLVAKRIYNWQQEENKLVEFYRRVLI